MALASPVSVWEGLFAFLSYEFRLKTRCSIYLLVMWSCYGICHLWMACLLTCAQSWHFLKALNYCCVILWYATANISLPFLHIALTEVALLSVHMNPFQNWKYQSFAPLVLFAVAFTTQWGFGGWQEYPIFCHNWGIAIDWSCYLICFHIAGWINSCKVF